MLENIFLERHGHRETMDGDLAHQRQQVIHLRRLQRKKDSIDGFTAEGGIYHQWRKRIPHRITCYSINSGRNVDLINAVGFMQRARSDLSRACFVARRSGSKGEDTPSADPKNAADDSLIAHADPDKVSHVSGALQEVHH